MGELRMADQRRQPARADLPAADVLMSIELRTVRRLAVVEVDHHELLEADASIELVDDAIELVDIAHRHSRAPEVRRVEAVSDARHVDASFRRRFVDGDQLLDALPDSVAAAGRVLQHQQRVRRSFRHAVEDLVDRLRDARHAGVDAGAEMRADVHVDERRTVLRCNAQFVLQHRDALLADLRSRSREVGKVRGVDGERSEPVLLHPRAERGQLLRQFGTPRPTGGIAGEDLESHRADRRGAIRRLDQARTDGEVGAEHAIESPCGRCRCGTLRRARCDHARILPQRRGYLVGKLLIVISMPSPSARTTDAAFGTSSPTTRISASPAATASGIDGFALRRQISRKSASVATV